MDSILSMPLYNDGECTWFPELWIHDCCVLHDMGFGDSVFMRCVAESSHFLGPFAYVFAGLLLTGMCLGRPLYHWIKRRKDDDV